MFPRRREGKPRSLCWWFSTRVKQRWAPQSYRRRTKITEASSHCRWCSPRDHEAVMGTTWHRLGMEEGRKAWWRGRETWIPGPRARQPLFILWDLVHWGQEEKGVTEDEMVGWHHWLNRHEFEQTPGDSEGQRSLEWCSLWGRKESDMTEYSEAVHIPGFT